jgi:hypothetical protein
VAGGSKNKLCCDFAALAKASVSTFDPNKVGVNEAGDQARLEALSRVTAAYETSERA